MGGIWNGESNQELISKPFGSGGSTASRNEDATQNAAGAAGMTGAAGAAGVSNPEPECVPTKDKPEGDFSDTTATASTETPAGQCSFPPRAPRSLLRSDHCHAELRRGAIAVGFDGRLVLLQGEREGPQRLGISWL